MILHEKSCKSFPDGTAPLNEKEITDYITKVSSGWQVFEGKRIKKEFPFKNFKQSMAFAQMVALVAEKEDHHPDMCIHYGSVEIELTTHSIGGLSENDFIVAAKI
ncbi:MAG TPA: 4a-hydroxytetrahydrobiopterin dehydratase, partial [Draconibacterium sp.]|nr:4a-hydroxytetrahydrobiopterin dehydratase [Draconibacterium sp.]